MSSVYLTGRLLCASAAEARTVATYLPRHVELTRAEDGCESFVVQATQDPLVWSVQETFRDAAAFATHQARVTVSDWGRETAGIRRDYEIRGLPDAAGEQPG